MEELPSDNEAFDVVTGINSFQYAGDIVRALGEPRRVCRQGGTVAMLVWGRKEDCDLTATILPSVFALIPPMPTAASLPLAEPGVMESLMREVGLSPTEGREIDERLVFPDFATVRAIMSAMTRAIRLAGEEEVKRAVVSGLERVVHADGPVKLKSQFRLLAARRE
jgi:Methyltransferase domain